MEWIIDNRLRCRRGRIGFWGGRGRFLLFYGHSLFGRPSGGLIFRCTFLPAALLYRRPPVAPSFVARRKIGEKGVPRRRKLHILRFAFWGKSSVIPLLLLSPPNPLTLGFGGAPVPKPPFGILLLYGGLGGETCGRPTNSP